MSKIEELIEQLLEKVNLLEAKNKRLRERIEELQEILHYGHIDQPLVAVIGKAMEEKRKAEQALKKEMNGWRK
jgi:cell division septum initiation protein DivIVA